MISNIQPFVFDTFYIEVIEKNQNEYQINRRGSDDVISPRKGNLATLRKQLRSSLAKGGDISDIDKIFEHVLNESKRVNESLQLQTSTADSPQDPRKSFLKFYETASKGSMDEEVKDFIGIENATKLMKSEAYYCTKHGRVKGILTIADTYIMYDPLYCEENDKFDQDLLATKFQACIDIQDVMNVDVIKLPNETSMYVKDDESRQSYLYDYYIQLSL